jgi:phytoene desaturase (3,4-didehydrolycopene-forming)
MSKVVIIGAGVGGVTLAAYLSKQGYDVSVYEKNDYNGGRCSLIHNKGFRFDQGPSLLLMPKVFERTFRDLGESFHDRIELVKCDPNYVVHFGKSNEKLTLSTDLSQLKGELERIEPGSFGKLLEFLAEGHVHYSASVVSVLDKLFLNWYDFFTLGNLSLIWKLHIFDLLYRRISLYFKTDELRQAFTFQSMYMGMSPYDAPATYNLLQYTEIAEGIWYPIGGFNKVIQELESIAKKNNTTFYYGKGIKKILCDVDCAKGIELEDGQVVEADIVISNADLVYTYSQLLPEGDKYVKKLQKLYQTSSTFSFYWNMSRKIPELKGHNIFLSGDYKESFDKIFNDHLMPVEPSFYVHVPSEMDPTAAPHGKDALMILCPVGHLHSETDQDWDEMVKKARETVINVLAQKLNIPNFGDLIQDEIINTPHTWQEKFNLWDGNALGLSHNILQVCYFRPSNQHKKYKNLYFVGASTHPGTGVPIILCGARSLAHEIMNRGKGQSFPWMLVVSVLVMLIAFFLIK